MELGTSHLPETLPDPYVGVQLASESIAQLRNQNTPLDEIVKSALLEYLKAIDTEKIMASTYTPIRQIDRTHGVGVTLDIDTMHRVLSDAEAMAKARDKHDVRATKDNALTFIVNEALHYSGFIRRPKQQETKIRKAVGTIMTRSTILTKQIYRK